MTHDLSVNSNAYWDGRFNEDWEEYQGPSQSRFFAQIAAEQLPNWLTEQLRTETLTLADWGCAQGDGTAVLANYVDASQIVGVDFSSIAVAQAQQRYSAIRFLHENWLESSSVATDRYDIVFSSNTLEHFHNAFEVLETISHRAKKAIVLALPYKEFERIEEHFFSFSPENIPAQLANGFELMWSKVIDCKPILNTLWLGDQIILVYAAPDWISALKLNLENLCIEQTAQPDYEEIIKGLNQSIQTYADQAAQLNKKIELIESAKAVQQQEMITLSNWASQIDHAPLYYAMKKYLRALAKTIFHLIPLNPNHKQLLKRKLIGLLRPSAVLDRSAVDSQLTTLARKGMHSPLWQARALQPASPYVAQPASLLAGRDIFIFSIIDWSFRIQRPQHLARSAAQTGKRVFFFSNHFIDAPTPGYQIEQLDPSLELYQVKLHVAGAPAIYFAGPSPAAQTMLAQSMALFSVEYACVASLAVVQHAYWYDLAFSLANCVRVYDCMDHHEGFGNVPEQLIALEKDLLAKSDLVVVTSSWLETLAVAQQKNVAVIRNAGEYAHFSHAPTNVYRDAAGRKIIGYFGAIAEWFDLELIKALASALPDALILLVGNDTVQASRALKDYRNVILTGEVPYSQLPYYVHAFDVCLLPFQVIPLTMATNPVKVYEYLAAGKPVVCVDLPEIAQFGDLVHSAASPAQFIAQVQGYLDTPDTPQHISARQHFAQAQTWDHRVASLIDSGEALPLPKISVIVLTYNNLDLTKTCLDSLLRWNDYPALEIIVVDNASNDDTPAYLTALHAQHPEIKVILNADNVGFAAGNNVGLKVATGDYVAMLNNDTVVTPGWALTLARHLQANPDIGLIGPVTNNIGNEAKITIEYSNFNDMVPIALAHTAAHMGQHFPLRTLAFFCVMMPRAIFEQVGYLDENFGLGFFEDDDYCRRIEALGKTIVCAEDVFVHHHLSASFNKLKSGARQALFDKNKAYFESKWGHWVEHEYRS
jgi:GT2 family glycosyltransferase/glycosyltransferase involved in cell wall biosynthesis